MAQTFSNTGTQGGNRESLYDFLSDINYKDTPFFSLCGKVECTNPTHSWVEDTLAEGSLDSAAEGSNISPDAANIDVRVKRTNYTDITKKDWGVSGTQNAVDKAGLGRKSEYDHQLERNTIRISLSMNKKLWNQTSQAPVPDSGTAGKMAGYFSLSGTTIDGDGAVITDVIYNNLCETLVRLGVKPDHTFCSGKQKRNISSWATDKRRFSEQKQIVDMVAVYEGDFGKQSIIYDKDVPTTKVAVTQLDINKVAMLRPFEHLRKGTAIDGEEGSVLIEATYQYQALKAVGSITNLMA